jgi:hypothetical protein
MAKRRRKKATVAAQKPLTYAKKRRFMTHLIAAEEGLKQLTASVKSLRTAAKHETFVPASPAAARRRRRKRG